VPGVILEIEPEWCGFEYFLVGDEIIIVNPRSMDSLQYSTSRMRHLQWGRAIPAPTANGAT
jgi:hypothetical protein